MNIVSPIKWNRNFKNFNLKIRRFRRYFWYKNSQFYYLEFGYLHQWGLHKWIIFQLWMKHTFHTIWIQLDPLFQFEPKLGVGHQSSILEVLSLTSIKNFTNSIIQALDMALLIKSLFFIIFSFLYVHGKIRSFSIKPRIRFFGSHMKKRSLHTT